MIHVGAQTEGIAYFGLIHRLGTVPLQVHSVLVVGFSKETNKDEELRAEPFRDVGGKVYREVTEYVITAQLVNNIRQLTHASQFLLVVFLQNICHSAEQRLHKSSVLEDV